MHFWYTINQHILAKVLQGQPEHILRKYVHELGYWAVGGWRPYLGWREGSDPQWRAEGKGDPGQSSVPQCWYLPPGWPPECCGHVCGQTALWEVWFKLVLLVLLDNYMPILPPTPTQSDFVYTGPLHVCMGEWIWRSEKVLFTKRCPFNYVCSAKRMGWVSLPQ